MMMTAESLFVETSSFTLALFSSICVDFFLKRQIVRGGEQEFLCKLCFLCIGCPPKNRPLFVKYFLVDSKLKIIEILYTRGGKYCSCEGSHLKKFEAKGRIDWKSKNSG